MTVSGKLPLLVKAFVVSNCFKYAQFQRGQYLVGGERAQPQNTAEGCSASEVFTVQYGAATPLCLDRGVFQRHAALDLDRPIDLPPDLLKHVGQLKTIATFGLLKMFSTPRRLVVVRGLQCDYINIFLATARACNSRRSSTSFSAPACGLHLRRSAAPDDAQAAHSRNLVPRPGREQFIVISSDPGPYANIVKRHQTVWCDETAPRLGILPRCFVGMIGVDQQKADRA
jgi:hypothetical protein